MADRVQFREDEDKLAYLESKGINPNELARRLLDAEIRRMKMRERNEWFRARGIKLDRPAAEIIREERDSH